MQGRVAKIYVERLFRLAGHSYVNMHRKMSNRNQSLRPHDVWKIFF